ncbi:MAG: pyridoxal-phosphate dependent enzyme [Bacteroidetes bacterium]|nr:MAG: pyridoxal-phosphate dependent enzyme [Bacteroidota bacterium]REK00342.1 MAG: pyridoxal-phosphate dependent enzyme [Bacteroidota bacterium]REK35461.1 MAG: pyridoxal-phosphate dependent enzyme [Bacteroidota bacterium]REK46855.1 MAG: pyridoxal-phosphate dependent enzyme [Bacteroidota bacterium]
MELHHTTELLQKVDFPGISDRGISLFIAREDLRHPFLSGNKNRKLKYNIEDYQSSGCKAIITFGGAWSNHLVACAYSCHEKQIPCLAIIRGEEIENPVINFLRSKGVKLIFTSRETYRRRYDDDAHSYFASLALKIYPEIAEDISDLFMIPEGGSNVAGVKGCTEMMEDIDLKPDFVVCPCGTGATLAGIAKSLESAQTAIGIAVLKGALFLEEAVLKFGADRGSFRIIHDFHEGGYARAGPRLLNFCEMFSSQTGIPVEPVYTGKMFFGLIQMIQSGYFPSHSNVLAIHTGGIYHFENENKM